MEPSSISPVPLSTGVAVAIILFPIFCGSHHQTASAFSSPHHHPRGLGSCYNPLLHNNGQHDVHRQSALYDQSLEHIRRIISNNNRVSSSSSTASAATTTRLHLFGNLFGNEGEGDDQKDLEEGELARFSHPISPDDNPNVKFDSLSIMISEWSELFVAADDDDKKKKMGLTTPVVVVKLKNEGDDNDNDDGVSNTNYCSGVQLLFQKGKTGGRSAYRDKDDEKDNEEKKREGDEEKEAIKEGGVEVKVEKSSGGCDLRVIASRCEIEEGTMVKEMSERTIIDSLRKAMAAWKKEQAS